MLYVWNEITEKGNVRFHDRKYSLGRYWWLATLPTLCMALFVSKVYQWKFIPYIHVEQHCPQTIKTPHDLDFLMIFICWLLSSCVKPFWINSQADGRQCHATIKNPPRSLQEVLGIIKERLCTLSKEEDLQNLLILIYKFLNYCFVRLWPSYPRFQHPALEFNSVCCMLG